MLPKLVCIFAAVSMTTAASLLLIGSTVPKRVEARAVPVAMVVPHHDLVSAQRAELFQEVKKQGAAPKTVILVSPNHFEVGRANIQTTDKTWETSVGTLRPNLEVIRALSGAKLEPDGFTGEHGIKLVLADIIRTFPDAFVVPIMLKFGTKPEEVAALLASLQVNCADCLLVASVDFSHYQKALLANLHDTVSRRILANLDQSSVYEKAEVDSPSSLALMMGWAEGQDARRFTEWKHTNSGVLLHDTDMETTTHVFGWYSGGTPVSPPKNSTFGIADSAGRDTSFDRQFWGVDASISNTTEERVEHFLGEQTSLSVLTFGAKAQVGVIEAAITAETTDFKLVVVQSATSEALTRWVQAGAHLVIVRSGADLVEKEGAGVVVYGTNTMAAGTFSDYGLDLFLVPTSTVDLHAAYTPVAEFVIEGAEGSLLHFPLK